MKARKVKKLDPDATFDENARRIVEMRVQELTSLGAKALEREALEELHDTRIAAKRLRYVLELSAPAFGRPATNGARVARGLQDLLGDVHDCDVMLRRLREHSDRLRAEDAEAVRLHADRPAADLEPPAALHAANLDGYRGLAALEAYLAARREILFDRFLREWQALERRDFAGKLLAGLSSAPRAREARADGAGP